MPITIASLTPLLALLVALMKRADRKLVQQLRAAGALSAARAIALTVPSLIGSMRLRRLISAGAIRSVASDRFFLDEPALARLTKTRRTRAFVLIAVMLLAVAVAGWLGAVRF